MWLICAVSIYGVVAGLVYLAVGVVLFIDQEYGITAFREWAAQKMWRSVFGWVRRPWLVVDLILGAVLMPLVYKLQLWRARPRRRYKTPYQER